MALCAILAMAYFCGERFGVSFAGINSSATSLSLSTGLALAALLWKGYQLWPGIFIGALFAGIALKDPITAALGMAIGNTIQALAGAWLINCFAGGKKVFEKAKTIFGFVGLAAVISPLIGITFRVANLYLGGQISGSKLSETWFTWWLGDMAGILVVTPLILTWMSYPWPAWKPRQILEGAALLLAVVWIGQTVFLRDIPLAAMEQLGFLSIPPLLLAAFRFEGRGATASAACMSIIAFKGTVQGMGPFATTNPNQSLLLLQIFIGIITLTALVLAAVVSEHRRAEKRLRLRDAVSHILAEAETLAQATPLILRRLCEVGDWNASVIWNVNGKNNEMTCVEIWCDASLNAEGLENIRQQKFTRGCGLPGRAWESGTVISTPDIVAENLFPKLSVEQKKLRSAFFVPLKFENNVFGVLACFTRHTCDFDDDFLRMLAAMGTQLGQFIQHMRAQELVRDSEMRFRQMAENINEVFWMTDPAKRQVLYVGSAYEEIWGRTCASLYAMPESWLDAVHPEDRERVSSAALTKQISGKYNEVYRIVRPDTSIRWIHDEAFPVRDEFGKIYRIVGVAEDITERKLAENHLTMLAHAVQSTAEMIYITDLDGRFTFVNRAFEQTYGYSEKEVFGKTLDIIFLPNNASGLKEKISGDSQKGSWIGEVLHRRKNGTEFPVLLSKSEIISANGAVHSFMGVARDISDYKRAQADLQRLATIVADSEDAIISMTLSGTIVTWNKAAQRIYGFSADEAISHSIDIVFPPVSADKMSQFLDSVAQEKKMASYETLCRRKDGSLIEISLTISPVSDASGKITGASVIARDVSERRKLEREVLEISTHERRRIGYELHDGLSQHLAGIAFKAKSLQNSLAAEEATHTGAAHEIVELVNDAMRQTRQVARNLDPTEVEASGLVAALERFCSETSDVFHVNCQFYCKELSLPLEAQTNLALFRIAQEAIRNALVHGGPEKIEVKLFVENGRLHLTIFDDGKGFDPAKRNSGVGLRLMQYRAHTIDAAFQLSSRPGAGTVVQCSLPFSFPRPKPNGVPSLAQDSRE